MKTKQLFFCSLTGLALLTTSCSSNDEALNGGDGTTSEGKTYAQIAISVANSATTRAVAGNTGDEAYGTDDEYTVNDLTVVLANENGIAMQVITPTLKTVSNTDEADRLVRVTEPFTCTPGSYKVYVLANYKNSQNALNAIIKGSTDMKAEFGLTDIAKLSTTDNFFMTNTSAPEVKVIKKDATGKEVDDAGKEMTDGKTNLNLLTVDVERAVSKVTFDNTDNQSFDIKVGDNKIATATLEGASLINLNKKMYLVKDGTAATKKPVTGEWPYPKDPNYDQTSIDEAYCKANFEQRSATEFPAPSKAKFYCPENTMEASAQLNGQTTGVVYKVKYVPEDKYYTELAAKNGTDSYSKMFEEVLKLGEGKKDEAITDKIFTEATTEDKTAGTFYSYNGYVFKTKAGARLYKAIATANTGDDAAAVNAAFKTNANDADIQTYTNGYCYYTAWIKHNPTSTVTMEQDKYGVVRNFWYELKVSSIKKLGYSKATYEDPKTPDDKEEASIQVKVNIKKWRLVKQNVNLE